MEKSNWTVVGTYSVAREVPVGPFAGLEYLTDRYGHIAVFATEAEALKAIEVLASSS